MNPEVATSSAEADELPEITAADFQPALLNILEDGAEERTYLEQSQRAMLNILEDVSDDKSLMEDLQRALLNILEDYGDEKEAIASVNAELEAAKEGLEGRVVERTRELKASNEQLEAFSYSVSHDLRGPLRAISGYGAILMRDHAESLDERGLHMLEMMVRNAGEMGELIDGVLEVARIGRGRVDRALVDLEGVFRRALDEALPGESDVAIELAPLPPCYGDKTLLAQLASNLVSNAVKYSASEPAPQIEIGFRGVGPETVYFVRDNGIGFEQAHAEKMFGVFERLVGADEFEGTGIGMAIASRVVGNHGGRIWAEGELGVGAKISFTLPLTPADESPSEPA